jgi:hypothetical protein
MENKSTPRDAVLAATPEASHRGLLEMALQVGITDPADPIWTMVGLAWAAAFGAETARERLEIIRQETARLPDLIAEEKKRAAGDLHWMFNDKIEKQIEKLEEIGDLARDGADKIRKVTGDLDGNLAIKKAAVLEEWTLAVGKAASAEADRAFYRSLKEAWINIGLCLLTAWVGGMGVMYLILRPHGSH